MDMFRFTGRTYWTYVGLGYIYRLEDCMMYLDEWTRTYITWQQGLKEQNETNKNKVITGEKQMLHWKHDMNCMEYEAWTVSNESMIWVTRNVKYELHGMEAWYGLYGIAWISMKPMGWKIYELYEHETRITLNEEMYEWYACMNCMNEW